MENKLDINADADYAFFEDLREHIIGAEDETGAEKPMPTPPRPGMTGIVDIAGRLREMYLGGPGGSANNPRPPKGWRKAHRELCTAIDAVYEKDAHKELDGGMGALDLGSAHFTVDGGYPPL